MLVQRFIYRAQVKKDLWNEAQAALNATVMPAEVVTGSVFRFERNLFFYYELMPDSAERTPDELFPALTEYLEECPFEEEKRHYIRMYDIFHYNRPVEDAPWRGCEQGEPAGWLIHLRPEKLASYIFYHHQLQEEYPGSGNKYGMIAINENLLFFYLEFPDVREEATWQGALTTKNSPRDKWGALMNEHFQFWDDERWEAWRRDPELVYVKRCESIGTI